MILNIKLNENIKVDTIKEIMKFLYNSFNIVTTIYDDNLFHLQTY